MKVDVILPVYNPGQWLFEASDSVINQTYSGWNLIIVDDCTPLPNKTISRIKKISEDHKRITYIRLNQNRRAHKARNVGVAESSEEVIAFLDQDDKWHPSKLDSVIKYFQSHPEIELVHSNIEGIDSDGKIIPDIFDDENSKRDNIPYSDLGNEELSKELFRRYSLRLCTVVVRRNAFEALGGFNESLFGGEDEEFAVRFAASYRIGHLPMKLTYRRLHSRNVSSTHLIERKLGQLNAIATMEKRYQFLGNLVRQKRSELLREVIRLELGERKRETARYHALVLFKFNPLDPRAYLLLMLSFLDINHKQLFNHYNRLKRLFFS